jgi:hypothetical protein
MMIIITRIRKFVMVIIPIIIGVKYRLFISKNKFFQREKNLILFILPSFISISCPQIFRDFFEQIDNFK